MMQIIGSFVTSLAASGAFELLSGAAASTLKQWQVDALKRKLTSQLEKYTEMRSVRYGENWALIEERVSRCIPRDEAAVRADIRSAGASRPAMLRRWMSRYGNDDLYRAEVEHFCEDWIVLLFATVRENDAIRRELESITAEASYEKLEELLRMVKLLLDRHDSASTAASPSGGSPSVKDRTEDYRYNWDAPLFLNDPNGEDPDVQTVSLCDVHIPLRYRVGKNRTPADEQKAPLLELLARPGGHLVLGDPGIGKSSLISRYLNASGDTRSQLVYRLTDFQISGKEERPGESLLEQMGITKKALEECILFLDGLDECGLTPENRAGFLNGLADDWRTLAGKNVSWVVTCRLGYLLENALRNIQRITLLPLEPGEKGQIDAFLTKYEKAAKTDIPPEKRSVLTSPTLGKTSDTPFGIPLILYMVAASKDVTVTKDSTLVTIYDQLFPALYAHSYDSYGHRLTETLQAELHLMSRKVALWMLLHEPGRAVIPEEVYCDIGASFGGPMKKYDVHRIASYLRMAFTEGKKELCFVHRTMFEYFVAEGFVALAVPAPSPEALSGAIARYWHSYDLSSDKQDHDAIRKYVSEKLEQKRASLDFPRWEQVGLRLLEKGVVRCCGDLPDAVLGCPVCGKTLKEDRLREHTAFRSLCWLLNRVRELTGYSGRVFESLGEAPVVVSDAIRHCTADGLPVSCPNFCLRGVNLYGADLTNSNLSGADLAHANLRRAILHETRLQSTMLTRADLTGASLNSSILPDAILTHANLTHANLTHTNLTGADLTLAILTGVDLYRARLTGVRLTIEDVKTLSYSNLASCAFDSIRIQNWDSSVFIYSRPAFFAKFFPEFPQP